MFLFFCGKGFCEVGHQFHSDIKNLIESGYKEHLKDKFDLFSPLMDLKIQQIHQQANGLCIEEAKQKGCANLMATGLLKEAHIVALIGEIVNHKLRDSLDKTYMCSWVVRRSGGVHI